MATNDKYKKLPKSKRKKSKGSPVALFLSLTMLSLSILLALCLSVFFKTQSITIEGKTRYSDEQIIAASGMGIGKNMFVSMFGGAAKKIETLLPYVGSAKIIRNLDGRVVIAVEPNEAAYCFESNGEFLLTDSNFKALEIVDRRIEDKPFISGAEISVPQLGKGISYTNKNLEQIVNVIFAAASQNKLSVSAVVTNDELSFLDVTIENKFLVHLLNANGIDYKLLHIKKSIDSMGENEGGIFTFSDIETGKAVFKPCDINAPVDEEPQETPENSENTESETGITSSENADE